MQSFQRLSASLVILCACWLAAPVLAGPTDPVSVVPAPEDQGAIFSPGVRLIDSFEGTYIEEEFFVSGESTLFNYAHNPPQGHTDIVPVAQDVPYTTRMIVRRPVDRRKFNGSVVVEWWNSTAGFDTAPVWDPSAEYFTSRGYIYVGVTNSTTSIDFLAGGCRLFGILPPACGSRYAVLSLPENGLAFEMMSQIASLLVSDDSQNPIPERYRVKRLYHAGESQQAGSLVTYASAFHLDDVNSGYFIQAGINARPINFGPSCAEATSPPFPNCTPRLPYPDRLVRRDVGVPIYQVITQTDFEALGFNVFGRQLDREFFRYYEVAGGSHVSVHKDVQLVPAGVLGPDAVFLEDLCANELNTTADGPVFVSGVLNALWQRMQDQVQNGRPPPPGVFMENTVFRLDLDANGNAIGGVRLPSMEAPTARYVSGNTADPALSPLLQNIGNLACRLSGSVLPFDAATLDALYPTHRAYVSQVEQAVRSLKDQGLLLPLDASRIRRAAAESDIGR